MHLNHTSFLSFFFFSSLIDSLAHFSLSKFFPFFSFFSFRSFCALSPISLSPHSLLRLFLSPMCLSSSSLPLSVLSDNGRHLWHFVQQSFGTHFSHSLRCTDLLSNRSVLFPLIGFSSIGQPLAIYWANDAKKAKAEEQMVLLDFKAQTQSEGGGGFVSQRMIEIDLSRRLALWVGPTHRQYWTGTISRILSVVLGSVRCAIVGKDAAEDGEAFATLLCVPRLPNCADWPSEVSLRGFSTSLFSNSLNSLFFLGRPFVNGGTDIEPSGQPEKLFFAVHHTQSGQFVAIPVCPLSASLPFRILPILFSHGPSQHQFPPPPFSGSLRHFSHFGGRFAMALFRFAHFGTVRWSLRRLDTFDLILDNPLMEWENEGKEEGGGGEEHQKECPAQAMQSADGGVTAVAVTSIDQQGTTLIREVRCVPSAVRLSVPSLCDIVLLSLQCSSSVCPIRQASCHLATHLKMIN